MHSWKYAQWSEQKLQNFSVCDAIMTDKSTYHVTDWLIVCSIISVLTCLNKKRVFTSEVSDMTKFTICISQNQGHNISSFRSECIRVYYSLSNSTTISLWSLFVFLMSLSLNTADLSLCKRSLKKH